MEECSTNFSLYNTQLILILLILNTVMSYDRFIDERLLTSRDALNKVQIKIKLIEIDENARDFSQRFGRRVLVKKVLLTIKYTQTEEVEEKELDVEQIESRMRKERLFSSSNRWVSSNEIKNGYLVASRHLDLLADAIALDIIVV
jgi:NH3-dependent NAD+ synthetase